MSETRELFRQRIEDLVTRFEEDVDRSEWLTRRYPKRLRDEAREVYEVPALYLQKGATCLLLDPIGGDMPGAEAAADLFLMPAYDPTATLYLEEGHWVFHHAFPPDGDVEILTVSRDTINQVLDSIAAHAVPSV